MLFNHSIRPREKLRRECQADLFCSFQVDHEFKLRRLLYRQISRFGTLQNLVDIKSCAPIEVGEVHAVGHEAAGFDIFILWINSRQPVLARKFDDPFSFGEKARIGGRHDRANLLLLCGLKGVLQSFGVGLSLDLFQF